MGLTGGAKCCTKCRKLAGAAVKPGQTEQNKNPDAQNTKENKLTAIIGYLRSLF